MRMMRFSFEICHIPEKSLVVADALSRVPAQRVLPITSDRRNTVQLYLIHTGPLPACGVRCFQDCFDSRVISKHSNLMIIQIVVKVFDSLRQPVEFCYGIVLLLWTSLSKLLIAVR